MDDIIVLAPTRWKPRRAVQTLHREPHALQLEKHPEKTFIGGIEKGFDFLGYRFTPRSLTVGGRRSRTFWNVRFGFMSKSRSPPPPTAHDGRGARGLPTA